MRKKLDGASLQDLYHYALAMQGNGDSTFPCETLVQRLEVTRNANHLIDNLDSSHWQEWDEVMPRADRMTSTDDLVRVGKELQAKCNKWAVAHGIDPHTGRSIDDSNEAVVGATPKRTLLADVGQGQAVYALVDNQWYSVNFDGNVIADVRWKCSTKERDQIVAILISRNRNDLSVS